MREHAHARMQFYFSICFFDFSIIIMILYNYCTLTLVCNFSTLALIAMQISCYALTKHPRPPSKT